MSRATPGEVLARLGEIYGEDHVHRVERPVFRGRPGHYYLLPRLPTDRELAQISARSRHAEAALLRINDGYFVKIGSVGIASMTLPGFRREAQTDDRAITSFELVAHTHPLEHETRENRVPRGPSPEDWRAIEELYRRWGQRSSYVIICRGGRVLDTRTFTHTPDPLENAGRLWTPSD